MLATQNPIEQEGTYPLPEAQLDRFMFMVCVDYPSERRRDADHENAPLASAPSKPQPVLLAAGTFSDLQQIVRAMPVAEHVYAYAEKIVRVTRPKTPEALDFCKKWLTWGAGPRAESESDPGRQGPRHAAVGNIM